MSCGNCHCIGHNRRTCQRGGDQLAELIGHQGLRTAVNIHDLIALINSKLKDDAALLEQIGEDEYVFFTTLPGFNIKHPVDQGRLPSEDEQIWPKEIWAVYRAMQAKWFVKNSRLSNMELMEIYRIMMRYTVKQLDEGSYLVQLKGMFLRQ